MLSKALVMKEIQKVELIDGAHKWLKYTYLCTILHRIHTFYLVHRYTCYTCCYRIHTLQH